MIRTLRWIALALAFVLGGVTACSEVPTSGPVDRVPGPEPTCRGCLNVDPADPRPGDDPKTIVEGYMQAMASYEPTYATARKYLTKDAAERWDPDQGVYIYVGQLTATTPTSIVLDARLVGGLEPDRGFRVQDQRMRPSFGLKKEDGEWRIQNPPKGLLIPKSTFDTFYDSYNTYYLGRDGTLVPDTIYLPQQANIPSALMLALLDGPSLAVAPVVTTALPTTTKLNVQSVTVKGGVARVQLSDAINELNDQQRTQMATQVAYTLNQAQVQAVQFEVDGEIYRVPGADPDGTFAINSDQVREVAAIPPRASEQLYGAVKRGARLIEDPAGQTELVAVPGEFGDRGGIESMSVSLNERDLAVVTNDSTVLRQQPDGGEPTVVIKDANDLIRPQYSRQGELWAIGQKDGTQHIWVQLGDQLIEAEAQSPLGDARIVAFRISPDGSRIAMIREVGSTRELGMAWINRLEGRITVGGWSRLDTAANQGATITQFRDVAWRDDSRLMVIGSAGPQAPVGVFEVSQDASTITSIGELADSKAVEIATAPAHNQVALLTSEGYAYRLDAARRWARMAEDLNSLTYPG